MHVIPGKGIPRWARVLLVLLALILFVILIVPYFLNVDRYRPMIVTAIQDQTGRPVTIGAIRAKLFPRVGFEIENFALANPRGFAEGNLLTVDSIRGGLAWGPFFSGEIRLDSVELVHPTLVLLEDDRGQTNYDLAAKKKPAASTSSGFRLADIPGIRLTDVDVTLARVSGRKRTILPLIHVSNLSADLDDIALDATRLKQWTAAADLAGVRGELSGIRGQVEFRSGEFQLRQGAIESEFDCDIGKLARVKGTIHVADIEKAVVEFDLSPSLVDLEQVAAATQPAPSAPAATGKSELIARGRLAAERIRFAPYEATGAKADLRIFTDRIEIWPVTMALYGGSLGVSGRVDRRQAPERFSANIEARNVDVGKMMAASPETRGKITGTGELTLQAFGSLGSTVLNSLTGKGNFAVRDGRLPAINLGGTMQALAKMQQVFTLGQSGGVPSGESTFSAITGDLSLGGGRVSSNCIHVDSNAGTVDMRGSFGFDQTLKYDGKANPATSSSEGASNPLGAVASVLGGVVKQTAGRIPSFSICCTFADPKIRPGMANLPSCEAPSAGEQQPAQQPAQPPEQKKSIFDIFKKP